MSTFSNKQLHYARRLISDGTKFKSNGFALQEPIVPYHLWELHYMPTLELLIRPALREDKIEPLKNEGLFQNGALMWVTFYENGNLGECREVAGNLFIDSGTRYSVLTKVAARALTEFPKPSSQAKGMSGNRIAGRLEDVPAIINGLNLLLCLQRVAIMDEQFTDEFIKTHGEDAIGIAGRDILAYGTLLYNGVDGVASFEVADDHPNILKTDDSSQEQEQSN